MKRSVKLIALVCALAVVCGGYLLIQNRSAEPAVTEESGSCSLTAKTADDITGIAWTREEATREFVKRDGTWKDKNSDYPVNGEVLDALAEMLSELTATRKVTDVTAPADYGVTEPQLSVTVTYDDGNFVTYSQGSATPFADGYYLRTSEADDVIYTLASSLISDFDLNLMDLAVSETPALPENPTRITAGGVDVTAAEPGTFADASIIWTETETGLAVDTDKVQTLVDQVTNLSWNTLESAEATDEELATMGLTDTADTVKVEGTDSTLILRLGAATASGSRYARLGDSRMVYTVSESNANALLNGRTADLWPETLIPADLSAVTEITLTADNGKHSLKPETVTAETETGEEAEDGETEAEPSTETVLSAEKDKNLWSALTGLTATAREDDATKDRKSLLSVRWTTPEGVTSEIAFTEYDVDSYAVSQTGYPDRLVSAAEVDKLLRILRAE